jgi:peroxiredoxin
MKSRSHKHLLSITLLLAALMLQGAPAGSQNPVTVRGQAPSYAGGEITFYRYTDYITRDTTHLGHSPFDSTGHFSCRLQVEQTEKVFTNLGSYQGYFFAEPGKDYELALPEKKEKSQAQKLNPFFEGIPVHLGIEREDRHKLNFKIYRFSAAYEDVVNKNLENIRGLARRRDSVLRHLDTAVTANHPFFKSYKQYTLAGLMLPLGRAPENIKKKYFAGKPLMYNNPAYMETFSTLYDEYLMDLFSDHGNRLYWIINGLGSYSKLDSLCRKDTLLAKNDSLRELVAINALNEAYHDERFSRKAVRDMLKTLASESRIAEHKQMAQRLYRREHVLSAGKPAPSFCLYDADSNRVCLDDYRDQYIYLGFCTSKDYSCIRDYKLLENLQEKHRRHFRIIIISSNSFKSMRRYVRHHDYSFTFLHGGDNDKLLRDYRVKNMPAYYFIEPGGKLSIAPAPPPSENIEERIYRKMKANGDL